MTVRGRKVPNKAGSLILTQGLVVRELSREVGGHALNCITPQLHYGNFTLLNNPILQSFLFKTFGLLFNILFPFFLLNKQLFFANFLLPILTSLLL